MDELISQTFDSYGSPRHDGMDMGYNSASPLSFEAMGYHNMHSPSSALMHPNASHHSMPGDSMSHMAPSLTSAESSHSHHASSMRLITPPDINPSLLGGAYRDEETPMPEGDDEDDDDEPEDKPVKGRKTKDVPSRRKIDIEYIEDRSKRNITFSKRKAGIMKKAYELSTLTGTQCLLLVVSETGLVYTYTTDKFQPIVSGKQGKQLIQNCLLADTINEDGTGVTESPYRKAKKNGKLTIKINPNSASQSDGPATMQSPYPSPSYSTTSMPADPFSPMGGIYGGLPAEYNMQPIDYGHLPPPQSPSILASSGPTTRSIKKRKTVSDMRTMAHDSGMPAMPLMSPNGTMNPMHMNDVASSPARPTIKKRKTMSDMRETAKMPLPDPVYASKEYEDLVAQQGGNYPVYLY